MGDDMMKDRGGLWKTRVISAHIHLGGHLIRRDAACKVFGNESLQSILNIHEGKLVA